MLAPDMFIVFLDFDPGDKSHGYRLTPLQGSKTIVQRSNRNYR